MVGAWHGHGMASVNQTRPHCVNQMGKTHYKPLATRHGRGTAWARHGNGMLSVNRPEISQNSCILLVIIYNYTNDARIHERQVYHVLALVTAAPVIPYCRCSLNDE